MFKKAQRTEARLRLALCGVSGAGKTYSALLIAKGLLGGKGKIGMIDTERGSGALYSHMLDYDVAQLTSPFSPQKYIAAIKAAEEAGYGVLIIDSLSHAWAGEGGILDLHDKAAKAVRSTFTAWREVTPQHNKLVDAILNSSCHIIATMRTKMAYEIQQEDGKTKVTKVGLAPIQREGLEYEFSVVLDLSVDGHIASASKDRTSMLDGLYFKPNEETGRWFREWLNGKDVVKSLPENPVTFQENVGLSNQIYILLENLGFGGYLDNYSRDVCQKYQVEKVEDLSKKQVEEQVRMLKQLKDSPRKKNQFVAMLREQRMAA